MKITKNLSQVAVILETELLKGSFLNDFSQRGGGGVGVFVIQVHKTKGIEV